MWGFYAKLNLLMASNQRKQMSTRFSYRQFVCIHYFHVCSLCLTRLPDSAALRLCFVLGDTRSPGLGSLSLPVSSRLIRSLTLQQLLRTASPDERARPWRRRGRDERLLTAFPHCTVTSAGQKKKRTLGQDDSVSERLNIKNTDMQ